MYNPIEFACHEIVGVLGTRVACFLLFPPSPFFPLFVLRFQAEG